MHHFQHSSLLLLIFWMSFLGLPAHALLAESTRISMRTNTFAPSVANPVYPDQTEGLKTGGGIRISGELHDFLDVITGMRSDVQFYDLEASGLAEALHVSVERPFAISLDCYADFEQTISLSPVAGSVESTRIFVRFLPEHTGAKNARIRHVSDGLQDLEIPLSGEGSTHAIPQGYYSSATAGGSRLKTQLHQIIRNHQAQTYSSLWNHFYITDATFAGKVWDIYSDIPCDHPPYIYTFGADQDRGTGGNREGDVYNREHSMPRSWFGGAINPMHTDLFHIYPVDKWVNAVRANEPFGEVDQPVWTSLNGGKLGPNNLDGYSGTAFEPIDEYKGDLARTFFYMITRYEDWIESWDYSPEGNHMLSQEKYPGYHPWVIDMLIDWHERDPVSQKEIRRNNLIYDIQGNRNPFIDHPEFVQRIWADTTLHDHPSLLFPTQPKVYPNPGRDLIRFEASEIILGIRLYCFSGRILAAWKPESLHGAVPLPPLPAGPYLLVLQAQNKLFRQRILLLP